MADVLTRRFQDAVATIRDRAANLTERQWAALSGYDEADIEAFAEAIRPTIRAAKQTAVRTGVSYYATRAEIPRPPAIAVDLVKIDDIDPREPFIAYWTALKNGRPVEEALASGSSRIRTVVEDYTTSSARRAGDVLYERTGHQPRRWIRVPDAGACEWCHTVAPGDYSSAESADFGHRKCNCTPEPEF